MFVFVFQFSRLLIHFASTLILCSTITFTSALLLLAKTRNSPPRRDFEPLPQ